MSKRWRGITSSGTCSDSTSPPNTTNSSLAPLGRFQTRSGHICVLCGFVPTTKNKYRELQDHLVRIHFRDAIKAALPTRRPYQCPEKACNVEGKDWQALMRHYTGKHGILDAYLKQALSNNGHVTIDTGENNITINTLGHGQQMYQDNTVYISHEDMSMIKQDDQQVEVVTSFELPSMMTTLEETATTITTSESCLQGIMEAPQPPLENIQIANQQLMLQPPLNNESEYSEVITSDDHHLEEEPSEDKRMLRKKRVLSETEVASEDDDLAAQINTVSSTIQFPTTIPLMLGATATKRVKNETQPEVLINEGTDGENYAFVDLKYFLASPSKVMALPYKIILPQVQEEETAKSFEDQVVQVDLNEFLNGNKKVASVECQTDPWYPTTTEDSRGGVLVMDNATTINMDNENLLRRSDSTSSSAKTTTTTTTTTTSKELDFSMF